MSLATLEARLAELESQAAFQDELQQRLDEIVARHDGAIRDLGRRIDGLATQLAELGAASPAAQPGPADEIPPHY